ncbi:tubulin binding cofactor C-domain-containing protein [Cyathus striatus]|nr:tubulin binding cofactor C-domain-containing protein [Cyathus striatus]
MAEPLWSFSQAFSTQFQTARSELESRVNAATTTTPSTETLQSLSLELSKLTKSLADAAGSIPNYDQKQYEIQLKELEKLVESLRAAVPKSRFAFKRKAAKTDTLNTSSTTISTLPQLPQVIPEPSSKILSISDHSWKYLDKDALSGPLDQTDLSISDLDYCIVNLLDRPEDGKLSSTQNVVSKISALHVRNLTNTVLILPAIEGSALVHDLKKCTILLACHQFRMHTSQIVDVYLNIPSNPIIEQCQRIRFSGYPQSLISSDSMKVEQFSVQDFSHIRSTPSPNWSKFDGIPTEWPLNSFFQKDDIRRSLVTFLPS